MNTLRLTILIEPGVSKSDLANTFGNFKDIVLSNRFMQFNFKKINMMNQVQLMPIMHLLETLEKKQQLTMKMFHLADEKNERYSPTYLYCYKGVWQMVNTFTNTNVRENKLLHKIIP